MSGKRERSDKIPKGWKRATGFNSRRQVCYRLHNNFTLSVWKVTRVGGVFVDIDDYEMYIDNDWVGRSSTIQGATIGLLLMVEER